MQKILGISAFYHDSAAALVVNGKIVAAAQEERFTRQKHTPDFPTQAIRYCLDEAGLTIDELDAVVFYDKPLLKFERLLETYYAFAPKGLISFLKAIPVWINEKLFLKKMIYDGLREVETYQKRQLKLLFSEHHLSHAASAFFASPFREAAILTIDGVGEWSTASIGRGSGNGITIQKELHFPHSVGLLYSAFTYYLGFRVNSGEYKLMGLAPYGNLSSERAQGFIQTIKTELIDLKEDGSLWLNQHYFNYATGLRMVKDKKWAVLFGFPRRQPEAELEQIHCDLAIAIQTVTEEIVLKMARTAQRLTKAENLCLAGGVALNCVANGKLLQTGIFKNIYIQPAAGDAGGALGAALAIYYMYYNAERVLQDHSIDNINDINDDDNANVENVDAMQGAYLGPSFSDKEIMLMNKRNKARYERFDDFEKLANEIAEKIEGGQVVGWFQGRMEFGPRALGNRSILGDPRSPEMQKKINLNIKYRESFRPFAPSVLAEDAQDFFELKAHSPYMLLVCPVQAQRRNPRPANYENLSLWDKLYHLRSDVPAITHLDYSARIQTVHRETNPRYWQLLQAFKARTGYGMLVNTSFNVRGEPIVCTPQDAYRCFMSTEMDYLVINDYVYKKTNQLNWADREKWRVQFKED